MKCPECGGAELVPGVKEVPFTYKGRTIMLETHADFCPVCGEGVLSDEEADRLDGLSEVFRRKVNEELFDPAFVLSVRKKLGLDQRQAGELFGGELMPSLDMSLERPNLHRHWCSFSSC